MASIAPPAGNVTLTWQGVGFSSGKPQSFEVTCGKNPPTITAGYAQWAPLKRPLQRSLTIFQGYDPAQMTVNVIFGRWNSQTGWATDDATGQSIEADIATLEWMAGRGITSGPPPIVYVWSYNSSGGDLIPAPYASTKAKPFPWIISSAPQWGTAIRNANMYRVWQEATVTLENYLNLGKTPPPDQNTKGSYVVSRRGMNTALLIAGSKGIDSPLEDHRKLAERILGQAKNNPCKGTRIRLAHFHVSSPITVGTPIWCPGHIVQ
jgi:hypothetical protein